MSIEAVRESIITSISEGVSNDSDLRFLSGLLGAVDGYMSLRDVKPHIPAFLDPLPDEELLPPTLGERITLYRNRRGFSQAYVAREIGITKFHMNRIERNKASRPRVKIIEGLAGVLKLYEPHISGLYTLAGRKPGLS